MGMPTVGIARLHKAHGQCPPARPWAMSQSSLYPTLSEPRNAETFLFDIRPDIRLLGSLSYPNIQP
jgi:hypothetical protein